jgi:hypothetical protein
MCDSPDTAGQAGVTSGLSPSLLSDPRDNVERGFERRLLMMTRELMAVDDVELIEELSMLTTQTARLRSRMADIMSELDRRRAS